MKNIELASGVSSLSWASTTRSWVDQIQQCYPAKAEEVHRWQQRNGRRTRGAKRSSSAIPQQSRDPASRPRRLPKLGHRSEV